MKLYIEGDGVRENALREVCAQKGHAIPDHGPWDAAVLPLPRSAISEETLDQLPPGQIVICGLTDGAFDAMAKKRKLRLCRALNDERFALENASLTAEGAVYAAMGASSLAIRDARCLVSGYGRIGKRLTELLISLGAHVTVAARRQESRDEAGENSIPIGAVPDALPDVDLVFNTVPALILDENALRFLPRSACLIELASPPYGTDLDAARRMGLNVLLESGVPGRYCPRSAALVLLDYIERMMES